jgi:hypothetical protein
MATNITGLRVVCEVRAETEDTVKNEHIMQHHTTKWQHYDEINTRVHIRMSPAMKNTVEQHVKINAVRHMASFFNNIYIVLHIKHPSLLSDLHEAGIFLKYQIS